MATYVCICATLDLNKPIPERISIMIGTKVHR